MPLVVEEPLLSAVELLTNLLEIELPPASVRTARRGVERHDQPDIGNPGLPNGVLVDTPEFQRGPGCLSEPQFRYRTLSFDGIEANHVEAFGELVLAGHAAIETRRDVSVPILRREVCA